MTTLNKLFKIEFERGTGKEPNLWYKYDTFLDISRRKRGASMTVGWVYLVLNGSLPVSPLILKSLFKLK